MKKTLLLFAMVIAFAPAFAQLSTRENDATVEKLGARPQMGDMALTFSLDQLLGLSLGAGSDNGSDTVGTLYKGNGLSSGNLITGKYYIQNDVAIRAGIRLGRDNRKSEGSIADSTAINGTPGGPGLNNPSQTLQEVEYRNNSRDYILVPGIEKHFNGANIFDVYAGGDLYLGFGRDKTIMNETYKNGDFDNREFTTGRTVVGLGGVIGINVFIAHLPISVGLEYGWNARFNMGFKTKATREQKVGTTTTSLDYETESTDPFGNPDNNWYSEIKKGRSIWDTNQDVRIILAIYFGK